MAGNLHRCSRSQELSAQCLVLLSVSLAQSQQRHRSTYRAAIASAAGAVALAGTGGAVAGWRTLVS